MSERWFNEGGTVLDENRLPVAHVVGQEEDDSDAKLIAAAPLMYDELRNILSFLERLKLDMRGIPTITKAIESRMQCIREVLSEARDQ